MSEFTGEAAHEFRRLLTSVESGAVGLEGLPSTPPPCLVGTELPGHERRYLRATVSLIWRLVLSSACVVAARRYQARQQPSAAEVAGDMAEHYRDEIDRETGVRTETGQQIARPRRAELDREALRHVTGTLGLDVGSQMD